MSKSKEEILNDHLAAYSLRISDITHGTTVIPYLLKNAMDEYSRSQCIAFAEWISKNNWQPNGTDTWENWEYPDQHTTDMVYNLFIQQSK